MDAARRNATYEDLLALPPHVTGQILFGVLHAFPRPAPKHARAASVLGGELGPPFDRGRNGPGGWVILDEPELHLGPHVVVPDLAGWRRARMPEMPVDKAFFTLAPDWVCEVLSPSTAAVDRGDKRAVYAAHGVSHLWFVDPEACILEVLALDGETYRVLDVFSGGGDVHAAPFDELPLELGALWTR
ncbi:MAG: Uma2 family endonuclease [Proteobacteria bacterium]|nr:MAG: Uma2 family endonuclease [Pseudomonadota bacterium]